MRIRDRIYNMIKEMKDNKQNIDYDKIREELKTPMSNKYIYKMYEEKIIADKNKK